MSKQLTVDQYVRLKPLDGFSSATPSEVLVIWCLRHLVIVFILQLDTGLGDQWLAQLLFPGLHGLGGNLCDLRTVRLHDKSGYSSSAL